MLPLIFGVSHVSQPPFDSRNLPLLCEGGKQLLEGGHLGFVFGGFAITYWVLLWNNLVSQTL